MSEKAMVLESAVRQTFGGVVWSHKIQEKQADIYAEHFRMLETAKIAAASLTSVGIVSMIFTDQLWIKIASALISFVSIFVSAFFKSFDLQAMVSQHKAAANSLLAIRDEIELLILQIRLHEDNTDSLAKRYEDVVRQLDKVYADAPNTTDKAVELARVALCITKDNTFTDGEIDSFLPEKLRKGNLECH